MPCCSTSVIPGRRMSVMALVLRGGTLMRGE
jgi:hypothetical protein